MPDKNRDCKQLKALLKAEMKVIKDHLEEHKWFQHIENENHGMIDFIEKYGWIMREMYCGYACPDRINCAIAQQFLLEEEKREEQKIITSEQQATSEVQEGVCDRDVGFGV
jgi:hypothetical protein